MLEHDPDWTPPDVTSDQIERAYDVDPQPFPEAVEAGDDGAQDDPVADQLRGLILGQPNTPAAALKVAKHYDDDSVDVGVGFCLKTVRTYFAVAALWPDAETAFAHSAPFHHVAAGEFAPRGSVGLARNGRHGHVWINLGGGLVRTTDFHRPGMVDVALESRVLSWCGALEHGWGEVLNSVDVWPSRKVRPRPPIRWTAGDRAMFLQREIRHALENGHPIRAEHLKVWRAAILARMEGK